MTIQLLFGALVCWIVLIPAGLLVLGRAPIRRIRPQATDPTASARRLDCHGRRHRPRPVAVGTDSVGSGRFGREGRHVGGVHSTECPRIPPS